MMLTLDLDTKSKRVAYNKARLCRQVFGKRTFIRRSASGNGYHVKVHGMPADIYSHELLLMIRRCFGDDPLRIAYDIERYDDGICVDVLFTNKGERQAGEWEEIKEV